MVCAFSLYLHTKIGWRRWLVVGPRRCPVDWLEWTVDWPSLSRGRSVFGHNFQNRFNYISKRAVSTPQSTLASGHWVALSSSPPSSHGGGMKMTTLPPLFTWPLTLCWTSGSPTTSSSSSSDLAPLLLTLFAIGGGGVDGVVLLKLIIINTAGNRQTDRQQKPSTRWTSSKAAREIQRREKWETDFGQKFILS